MSAELDAVRARRRELLLRLRGKRGPLDAEARARLEAEHAELRDAARSQAAAERRAAAGMVPGAAGRRPKLTTGERFGLLTFVRYGERTSDSRRGRPVIFVCDCGRERTLSDVTHLARVRLECVGHGLGPMTQREIELLRARRGGGALWARSQAEIQRRSELATDSTEREMWLSAIGVEGAEGARLRKKLRAIYGWDR